MGKMSFRDALLGERVSEQIQEDHVLSSRTNTHNFNRFVPDCEYLSSSADSSERFHSQQPDRSIDSPVSQSSTSTPKMSWCSPNINTPSHLLLEQDWSPWKSLDYFHRHLKTGNNSEAVGFGSQGKCGLAPEISHSAAQRDKGEDKSRIMHIAFVQRVNFANAQVRFLLQINENFPVAVTPSLFDVVVISPRGFLFTCKILKCDYPKGCFEGTFRSPSEPGVYSMQLKLKVPVRTYYGQQDVVYRIISEAEEFTLSRNYYKTSKRSSTWLSEIPDFDALGNQIEPKVWGLACDQLTNRLYYTDRATHKITCLSPEGQIICRFGNRLNSNNLTRPAGIACDQFNRRVIVADKDNHRVCIFSMDGEFISTFGHFGHTNGMLNYPWDVAASPLGDTMAVADSRNRRVQLFDRNGFFIGKYSVFETNPFEYKDYLDYPRGICFNRDGSLLYVSDFNMHNIIQLPVDLSSGTKLVSPGELRRPQGIAVDSVGDLLVADSKNRRLRHISPQGQVVSSVRITGDGPRDNPINLAFMNHGKVAVLDGNGRIRIF